MSASMTQPEAAGGGTLRLLRVATRCATVTGFVERFAPYCRDDTLTLPWTAGLARGTVGRFILALSGGAPVMRGRMQVLDVLGGDQGDAPRVKVRLLELDDPSHDVHGRMMKLSRDREQRAGAAAAGGKLPPPVPGGARKAPPGPGAPAANEPLAALVASCSYDEDVTTPSVVTGSATGPIVGAVRRGGAAAGPGDTPRVTPTAGALPEGMRDTPPTVDMAVLSDAALADLVDPRPLPHLTPPVSTPVRPTGKVQRTGKSLVARRTRLPPALDVVVAPLAAAGGKLLQLVPEAQRARVVRAAPLVGLAVVAFILGRCSAGEPPQATRGVEAPGASVPAVAPVVRPGGATPVAPIDDAPAATGRPLPRCLASVASEPEGVEVQWGEVGLGKTPVASREVPCGRNMVVLSHPRFEPRVLNVTALVGRELSLNERLRRPDAVVLVESEPPGAQVALGEEVVGVAPRRLEVPRYEPLTLTVTKPGFAPWSRTLTIEREEESVKASLRRAVSAGGAPRARARGK